jgi:molybdopterin-guanine dinucleotide biosynthesis protein B
MEKKVPVIVGFAGFSNTGKTTLISNLIPFFTKKGLKVATLKHAGHGFDMDRPGKDTHKHKSAGAFSVMIVGPNTMALIRDMEERPLVPDLAGTYLADADIVLVEGFKSEDHPKVEVLGDDLAARPRLTVDSGLVAVVGDQDLEVDVPVFSPSSPGDLARWIEKTFLDGHQEQGKETT